MGTSMTSKHNMFPTFSPAYQIGSIGSRLPSLQMNPTASLYAFFRNRLCVQVIEVWSSFHNDNYSNSGDGDGDDSGDCEGADADDDLWKWSLAIMTSFDDHYHHGFLLSSQSSMVLVSPSRLLLANLGRQDPGDSREVRYKGGRLEVSAKLRFRGVSWSQPVVYVCSLMYVFFQPWRLRVLF